MIDKLDLVSIISKYHLNNIVNRVRWNIEDGNLNIRFNSPTRDLFGLVEYKGFPLEDSTIAFADTSQLVKLIAITNGYINLEYVKNHKLITKLILADNQYTLDYSLADLGLVPEAMKLADDFVYDVTAEIDNESIVAIVKAKQALSDSNTVVVKNTPNDDGEDRLEMCFAGNAAFSNKVSFYLSDINFKTPEFEEHYNSDIIKEVMYCNKDMVSGRMSLCFRENAEHMKLEFENDKLKTTYILVAKEK